MLALLEQLENMSQARRKLDSSALPYLSIFILAALIIKLHFITTKKNLVNFFLFHAPKLLLSTASYPENQLWSLKLGFYNFEN